jgi:anti-sigma regulatory factor (Ser/Thr protein kinase)
MAMASTQFVRAAAQLHEAAQDVARVAANRSAQDMGVPGTTSTGRQHMGGDPRLSTGQRITVQPSITEADAAPSTARWTRRSLLELGALPTAVPCARLHARQVLWEWGLSEVAETAELLLSELVTNAVQAAQATVSDMPVNARVSENGAHLRVEVWDGCIKPPIPRVPENGAPALDAESGRGLFLVEMLSESWGWYPTRNPQGKVTWFEMAGPGAR